MSCNCEKCGGNSNIKICSQSNIPQVDNTALECSDCGFISTTCVIIPEEISYLGLPENTDVTTFINTLLLSLIDARNRVQALENIINSSNSNNIGSIFQE